MELLQYFFFSFLKYYKNILIKFKIIKNAYKLQVDKLVNYKQLLIKNKLNLKLLGLTLDLNLKSKLEVKNKNQSNY